MGTYFRILYPYCYGRNSGNERMLTEQTQGWGISPGKMLIMLDMRNAQLEAENIVKKNPINR
jgi:hypothetical protein